MKIKNAGLTRDLSVLAQSLDEEKRTVDIQFVSDAEVERRDFWGDKYFEVLTPETMRTERITQAGSLLWNHLKDERIGKVLSVNRDIATVQLSRNAQAEEIFQDIKDGIAPAISVGYRVHDFVVDPVVEGDGTVTIRATDWEPYEISFVSIAADISCGVRSQQNDESLFIEIKTDNENQKRNDEMPNEKQNIDTTNKDHERSIDEARKESSKTASEQTRNLMIDVIKLCDKHNVDSDTKTRYLEDGLSLADVQRDILEGLHERQEKTKVKSSAGHIVRDQRDTDIEGIENALLSRCSSTKTKLDDNGKRFRSDSLFDICKRFASSANIVTEGESKDSIITRVMSTGDFTKVLSSVTNKIILNEYGSEELNFTKFAVRNDLTDYKQSDIIDISSSIKMSLVNEAGEYKDQNIQASGETWRLRKYGAVVGMTREMIINDDIGLYDRTISGIGKSIRRNMLDVFWEMFLANPKMSDSVDFFHAGHKNLITKAFGDDGLSDLDEKIGLQKSKGKAGEPLNLNMSYLIVPRNLKRLAKKFMVSEFVPGTTTEANIHQGAYEVISEARLQQGVGKQSGSTTAYYGIADPAQIEGFFYGFLNGQETPDVIEMPEGNVDATRFKIRHDFAVKAANYNAAVKSTGTTA